MSTLALRYGALRRPTQTMIAGATLGLALLVLVAGWFIAVSPQRSKAGELDARIRQTQAQITAARSASASATAPKAAESKQLSLAMPDVPDIPRVVDELNSNAVAAGLTLVSIAPQPEETATGAYRVYPLTVVVQGNFFGVEAFLRRLRTRVDVKGPSVTASGRLFDVSTVNLQQTEPAPSILASLTVRVFVFAGAAPSTTPTAIPPTTAGTGG